MSLGTILLIILILILIGVIPTWPHSRSWGYAPGGIIGVILIVRRRSADHRGARRATRSRAPVRSSMCSHA